MNYKTITIFAFTIASLSTTCMAKPALPILKLVKHELNSYKSSGPCILVGTDDKEDEDKYTIAFDKTLHGKYVISSIDTDNADTASKQRFNTFKVDGNAEIWGNGDTSNPTAEIYIFDNNPKEPGSTSYCYISAGSDKLNFGSHYIVSGT